MLCLQLKVNSQTRLPFIPEFRVTIDHFNRKEAGESVTSQNTNVNPVKPVSLHIDFVDAVVVVVVVVSICLFIFFV